MRPLIAIVGRHATEAAGLRTEIVGVGTRYLTAIRRAGGQEVMLMPTDDGLGDVAAVLDRVDGVCLMGGGDVDPSRYGARSRHEKLYGVDDRHDAYELAVLEAALDLDLPTLAICRGMQVLNVLLGGSLHQHIGDGIAGIGHRFEHHDVELEAGSRVAAAMGTQRPVGHSVHHQAVDRLGDELVITGRARDGLVEAVELPSARWYVGVQWHPEDTAADDPAQQGLFDTLVAQARRRP